MCQHKIQHKDFRKEKEHENVLQALKIEDTKDESLQEEIQARKHLRVDSEIEKTGIKVSTYGTETLNTKNIPEKLDQVFKKMNFAAKVNLAFGFCSKNIEAGKFRYFYTHENNRLLVN